MEGELVCFINRNVGERIALDMVSRINRPIGAVVTNSPPRIDLDLGPIRKEVDVMSWQDFHTGVLTENERFDAGISVLFGHKIPETIIQRFSRGIVNLHPSFLPYGRGAHPATWAIWEQTPYGATAHFMSSEIDEGPIAHQEAIAVQDSDTSLTLYRKGLDSLWDIYDLYIRGWLLGEDLPSRKQGTSGSKHTVQELETLRRLALSANLTIDEKDRLTRALAMG